MAQQKAFSWANVALLVIAAMAFLVGITIFQEPVAPTASTDVSQSTSAPVTEDTSQQALFQALLVGEISACDRLSGDEKELCVQSLSYEPNPEDTLLMRIILSGDSSRCDELSTESYVSTCQYTLA